MKKPYGRIYLYINVVTGMGYVGKTTQKQSDRARQHKSKNGCVYFHRAIKNYGWDNFLEIELEDCFTEKQLNERERFYILFLNTLAPNGYNLTEGGEGGKYSEEARDHISVGTKRSYENNPNLIQERSRAWKEQMNDPIKRANWENGYFSKEAKEKKRKSMEEYYSKPQNRQKARDAQNRPEVAEAKRKALMGKMVGSKNGHSKRVVMYEKESGEFIRTWDCITDAIRFLGISVKGGSHITSVCRGRRLHAYGYRWRYYTKDYKKNIGKLEQVHGLSKAVKMLKTDGTLIKVYPGMNEASRQTGIPASSIQSTCSGKQHTGYGYKWEYAD